MFHTLVAFICSHCFARIQPFVRIFHCVSCTNKTTLCESLSVFVVHCVHEAVSRGLPLCATI